MQKLIMTVDDSKAIRLTVSLALKQSGYGVIEADGGDQALQLLQSERVDLVLCDLNMPGMDGIELLRRLKADPALSPIPVIMLTTELQKARLAEARAAGAMGWMFKPFKAEQLVFAVGRVFEKLGSSPAAT